MCLLEGQDQILAGTQFGDLYMWNVGNIKHKYEQSIHNLSGQDVPMPSDDWGNPSDSKNFNSNIDAPTFPKDLELVNCSRAYHKAISEQSQINHILSDKTKDLVVISHSQGLILLKMSSLMNGQLDEYKFESLSKINQCVSETVYLPSIGKLIIAEMNGNISLFNLSTRNTENTLKVHSKINCLCKINDTTIAIGASDSNVYIIQLDQNKSKILIKAKLFHSDQIQNYQISTITYDQITLALYTGVNGIGVFKWLYFDDIQTLVKIYPVTRGLTINKIILSKENNQLLISQSNNYILKYDIAAGFNGYYESTQFESIYDMIVVPIDSLHGQSFLMISGKERKSNKEDRNTAAEMINIQSNSLIMKMGGDCQL
ncbi:UNKNOWN [Stylonychia lemnae]|uniref:Uncharacterized protein n=1 Tax=Stylonychia lemnae TaxID=5949 RepID=A0A078AQN5_STYLE|nr:UNKNOWN [Stylonychia lemnae]|eukprot:CDW84750.1 UNKNOWN [Stylonychia lemnae]